MGLGDQIEPIAGAGTGTRGAGGISREAGVKLGEHGPWEKNVAGQREEPEQEKNKVRSKTKDDQPSSCAKERSTTLVTPADGATDVGA
jgi:hypothetical protein